MILAGAVFLFLGLELMVPMYTQQVLMLTGTATGLILMPASIAQAVAAPLFGKLLDKKGGRFCRLAGNSDAGGVAGGIVAVFTD